MHSAGWRAKRWSNSLDWKRSQTLKAAVKHSFILFISHNNKHVIIINRNKILRRKSVNTINKTDYKYLGCCIGLWWLFALRKISYVFGHYSQHTNLSCKNIIHNKIVQKNQQISVLLYGLKFVHSTNSRLQWVHECLTWHFWIPTILKRKGLWRTFSFWNKKRSIVQTCIKF